MSNELAVLRTAKAALVEGFITQSDFDIVKAAFLRAQQIKAGLDAGFIQEADYQQVKSEFIHSLDRLSAPSQLQLAGGSGAFADDQQGPPQYQRTFSNGSDHGIPKIGGARPKQSSGTSMSGISVGEEAVNLYYYLKAKSTYRWATWKINDVGNEVIIANVGGKDASYTDLLSVLPASDCRYAVFDYQFTNSEGCLFNKIVFINWAPDTAHTRKKMMYASTKDFFKGHLDGLSIELMGSDMDDLAEKDLGDAVRASVTRQ
ncbi:hypothetical protein WJX72_000830 [[Myrmecia] bisecta]|uniref:ADF-H domain-containing protein n=1 Tax=[Myrmecia] bisecta TaxID=41462 RepID=A0AAW1R4V7_9CHLO